MKIIIVLLDSGKSLNVLHSSTDLKSGTVMSREAMKRW